MSNFLEPYVAARARLIQAEREVDKLPHGEARDQLNYMLNNERLRLTQTMESFCQYAESAAYIIERMANELRAQQKGEQA